MLTKTKMMIAALVGTIGTAAVGGSANAQEFVPPPNGVTVTAPGLTVAAPAPVVTPVDYGYGDGYYGRPGVYYRDGYRDGDGDGWRREHWEHERREHERREWMRRSHRWYW